MSKPQDPYVNRGPQEFTSAPAPTSGKWGPPMPWIQIRAAGSGTMTVMHEDGSTAALTNLQSGDVLRGPFLQVPTTAVTRFWVGDGEPPTSTQPASAGLNGASVPAGGALTTGNILQVSGSAATTYGPLNLAGGANYVIGQPPMANSAAQQTNAFTAAFETLYSLALTSAAIINLPALADTSNHRVHFFNPTGSAAVVTPNTGNPDFIANSGGATAASAAGPTAGKMQTWVGVGALNRWVLWG